MVKSVNKKRTCVVTGGNSGIGKEIARSLAKEKYHVVIISRDPEKGKAALEEIKTDTRNDAVELVTGDLGTIEGCRNLAQTLLDRYPGIQVLINNAGVWKDKCEINADGLETSFMVNHIAPFILSNLLLERLRQNPPSRIVNVNAGLYIFGRLDPDKTPYGKDFSRFRTYANSKLCNILFTLEFARRIDGSGVTVNAVHPGVIRTKLGDTTGVSGWILRMLKHFLGTPEKGAIAPVRLATASELEGVNGKYFNMQKMRDVIRKAGDRELALQLWDLSSRFLNVKYA